MMFSDNYYDKLEANFGGWSDTYNDTYEDDEDEWQDGETLAEYTARRPVHFVQY